MNLLSKDELENFYACDFRLFLAISASEDDNVFVVPTLRTYADSAHVIQTVANNMRDFA